MFRLILLLLVVQIFSFSAFAKQQAAVAMPDRFSAEVARDILSDGGNAVDAAIAAQFVLAVTLPEAGNIGGGGFMTIYHEGKTHFLDYRETAPAKAHRDMYLDAEGNVIENLSLYGILSSGVPGTVDGMWKLHQKYATKPWSELIAPAINLAKNGFVVPTKLHQGIVWRINSFKEDDIAVNFADYFSSAKEGTLFKQPELANTLERIAKHGRDGFYKGDTADLIVKFMEKHGGLISKQDLNSYAAKWRTPLKKTWRSYEVVTAPPPSSGGVAILQWLYMYDMVTKPKPFKHNSAEYVHVLAEVGKRVFADRAQYLGDPDFVSVPVEKLLNKAYLQQRAAAISATQISDTKGIQPGLKESTDTTHFSIVDHAGNAIANTTTINYSFGSGMVVEGAGFILNDEMDDFSAKPGTPNVFGAIGGKANEIQPGKRMLSSMTPTIILRDDEVVLVTGSPGGTTIISSVYQSILNTIEFDMSASEAVNQPRTHHQLWPEDTIAHHTTLSEDVKSALRKLGYSLQEDDFGDLQLIIQTNNKLEAASQSGAFNRGVAYVID